MSKGWPTLLRFLNEELDYRVRVSQTTLGFETFYVDLSSWKLRFSNYTPVIWVKRSDAESSPPLHLVQSLQDVIRERGMRREPALILLDGDSKPLLKHTSGRLHNLIILGADEQERVIRSRRPSGELLDLTLVQIPISNLAPYETSSPVVGSRFFGRDYEISRILGNPDTNHLILGIRRIGKTSLLRETERILKEQEGTSLHVVYLDCSDLPSTSDYIREVVRKLNPKELPRLHLQEYAFFFPDFLERMRRMHKRKIVFLLDEIDNLILAQRGDWELLRMMRSSANKEACRYIMAGFREAIQEQCSLDSPFYNFAQEVRLNEFTRRQAHDLIVTPMENLGVHFRNKSEIVGRIYDETAGHPNLIQYYCTVLLRRLDQTGEREIRPDSLIDVYNDEGFKSHLLTSFMQNTQNREKAMVYALIKCLGESQLHSFTQADIDAALQQQGILLPQSDIDEDCNTLILAGVLDRKGRDFHFTSPVFTKMLQQTYDPDYLLKKIKEEGI